MGDNWVRCRRCHEVFEAAEVCPKCGAPYQSRVLQPQETVDSFSERYAGTEFATPEPPPPPLEAPRRNPMPFIVGGAALIVFALVAGALTGAWSGGPPPAPPIVVHGTAKPTATASPLPDSVVATMALLSDPRFTAAITVRSHAAIDARVTGKPQSGTAMFEGYLSGADQSGKFTQNATSIEVTMFGGVAYSRPNATAGWSPAPAQPTYLVLRPIFGLTKPEMLTLVGLETRDGAAALHFRSTPHWTPELNRMALMDLSGVGIKPDTFRLDLWTAPDGAPVYAEFSAVTTAIDGTKLIDVAATWSFADIGVAHVIPDPLATPSPSPSLSSETQAGQGQ
jgi:hypothetical protein